MGFRDMVYHIPQDPLHMLVGGDVEDLLAAAVGADQTRRLQKPQVVADQGSGNTDGFGDLAHVARFLQATGNDSKPRRVPEQMEYFGDFDRLVLDHVGLPV